MFFYNRNIAKKIESVAMDAVAKDSLSDCISTFVVLLSVFAQNLDLPFSVDGIAGIVVGLFIIKTGYDSAKETVEPLLGTPSSKEFAKEIEAELLTHSPIMAMHDLVVHDYGPGRKMISLHAEVPGDQNIFDLHETIDAAEVSISQKFDCSVVIHMDPVETHNALLDELKKYLENSISIIDANLKVHDVRIVPGKNSSNLIFDVVKPFNCSLTDEQLKEKFSSIVKLNYESVNCVITVDSPFV